VKESEFAYKFDFAELIKCDKHDRFHCRSEAYRFRQRSRYSDWVDGQPRGQRSNPGRVSNFLFSTAYIPALGPTLPLIQWVPWFFSRGVKRLGREADYSPATSAEAKIFLAICRTLRIRTLFTTTHDMCLP
jgi:hypothetical protein